MSHATAETRLARPRASADPPAEELVGADLGQYRLLELIGQGGMGRVYLAEHRTLGRRVAIKLLLPSLSSNRSAVARFFQEAQVVNRIRHHNIVDITDFVETADGSAFIVMELLEGWSLQEFHREHGPLPVPLILDVIGQVCEGLDATHRIGVIHRDLKPGNIFVCSDRSSPSWVKLLDFGVAKLADVELASDPRGMSAPHTAEGAVLGTPAYMSPGQAVGEELDARSDVYAIGTILYELVCGTPPFVAKRFVDYVHKHAAETPRPITEHDTGRHAPAALEAVISRCLEKRPERRYPDATALRAALADVQLSLVSAGPPRPRRSPWWIAFAALALGGIGYGAFTLASSAPEAPVTPVTEQAPEPSENAPASSEAAPPPPVVAPVPVVTPMDAGSTVVEAPVVDTPAPKPRRRGTKRRPPKSRPPKRPRAQTPPVTDPAPIPTPPAKPVEKPVEKPVADDGKEVHPGATVNPFEE